VSGIDVHALPCRPTIACTAEIVPPGALEIESGYLYRRLGYASATRTVPILAKLTIAEWLQAQVGVGPGKYFGDGTLGAKFHLVDQSDVRPAIAVASTLSVPTVAAEGYTRTYDAFFTAFVTKDLGPLHADFNTGIDVWRVDGAPLPQSWVALALSGALPAPFGALVEIYSFGDAAPVASRDAGVLFGLTASPRTWLVFDFGGDVGLVPSTRAFSAFVGMTVVPARLWR
jgi:hypothetical protein